MKWKIGRLILIKAILNNMKIMIIKKNIIKTMKVIVLMLMINSIIIFNEKDYYEI